MRSLILNIIPHTILYKPLIKNLIKYEKNLKNQ